MQYIKWFILVMVGIIITLLNVVLSPVIPLFINDSGYLPIYLSWFQTPDNPAIGDDSFHNNEMSWTTSRYLWGMFWAIRNPAYGYDAYWGAPVTEGFVFSTNRPGGIDYQNGVLIEGTVLQTLESGGQTYFEWCWVKQLTSTHYARISFGWHLTPPLKVGEVRNLTLGISPWMKIQ